MRAAFYERQGPAASVLKIGDLPLPEPGPGEVRVRITFSGVNPGDIKKRQDWLGYGMSAPPIVAPNDGARGIAAGGGGGGPRRGGGPGWGFGAPARPPPRPAARRGGRARAPAAGLPHRG